MFRGIHDLVGARGEALFRVLITRYHPEHGYLFDTPRFLGDKQRTVDFYVELLYDAESPLHFFVQVKSTRTGYTRRGGRLRVRVSGRDLQRLAGYGAPTYIVGIDEPAERGYIVSAHAESRAGFSSMSTAHPLEGDVLVRLRDEVEEYWRLERRSGFRSQFADPRWGGS